MFYTYLMASRYNGTLYCGQTSDIWARSFAHSSREDSGGFTAKYGVTHLVWFEEHETRHDAFVRERRIKKWRRAWKLELINDFNPFWLSILKCPTWPVPMAENELLAGVRAKCLACSLDPRMQGRLDIEAAEGVLDWPPHWSP